MLAFFSFQACLLWGAFIGGSLRRGDSSAKVHLPKTAAIFGDLLFTLPLILVIFFSSISNTTAIIALVTAIVGLTVGLWVGVKMYWVD